MNLTRPDRGKRLLAWWDRQFGAFITGLTEFSWLALGLALVLALAGIGLTGHFFSYATLSGPEGRFLAGSAQDAESHSTWKALNLSRRTSHQPLLVVLGSSVTATAYASEPALARELKAATGQDWDVALLATPLQSALDQLTMLEAVLGKPPGPASPVLIVIGTSPMRDGYQAKEILARESLGRLGLRSDWADAIVRAQGAPPRPRNGWYLFDNDRYVVNNARTALLRFLTRRAAPRDFASLAPQSPPPDRDKRQANLVRRIIAGQRSPDPFNAGIQKALVARLAAYPATRLAFIDEGLDPAFLANQRLTSPERAYRNRFAAQASAMQVPFWQVSLDVAAPPQAFGDELHIRSGSVQMAFRKVLALRIADLRIAGAHAND